MSTKEFLELLQPANNDQSRVFDLAVQIENILHSYDDQFDAFSEILQNSVDAVFQRWEYNDVGYSPRIDITIDYIANTLAVLDNGCGVKKSDIAFVLRPNCSLKRHHAQKSARGEKGAAVVFLQFGHRRFEFHSKTNGDHSRYILQDGQRWFEEMTASLNDGSDLSDLSPPQYNIDSEITEQLNAIDRGSFALVEFGERSNLARLSDMFGEDAETALRRLEYVLRTRTAIGFVYTAADRSDLPDCIRSMTVNIEVRLTDGTTKTAEVAPGFLYPHEIAMKRGSLASLMTNAKSNSELLYDFITAEFVQKHFAALRIKHKAIIDKYGITGYVSYAYNNQYYEELTARYLQLDQDDHEGLVDGIIQINGGFQVAVREYPNGRRHSFLQRSGAEDKSRSYVVLNFGEPYKPDYGRKNLSHDVRAFVNDFCKALMAFATQKDRKERLKTGKSDSSHGIRSLKEAKKVLNTQAERENQHGLWLISGDHDFERAPLSEDEVVCEFVYRVMTGKLPGFKLYGVAAKLQLDGLFDYHLPRSEGVIYDANSNPLGVMFSEHEDAIEETAKWLEFKISSDLLVGDFNRKEGDSSKKYFVLCDLLICYRVDDATEGFRVEIIDDVEQVQERSYFGVTHLLTSETDQSHKIPVICLEKLRKQWSK